jgi:DNA polymerase (family 10)
MAIFLDTHCHTNHSACGEKNLSLAWYQRRAGKRKFVITDHSSHIFAPQQQNVWWAWLDPDAETFFEKHRQVGYDNLRSYYDELFRLQSTGLRIGAELDVLPGGQIVFPDEVLGKLDFVVGAVHGVRGLKDSPGPDYDVEAVVANYKQRVLALLAAGVHSIAHPFTEWEMLNKDPTPLPTLLEWLTDAAKDAGAALEINSHHPFPEMDVLMIQQAVRNGVKLTIATDTHAENEFGEFAYHRHILAKAGISKADYADVLILNT